MKKLAAALMIFLMAGAAFADTQGRSVHEHAREASCPEARDDSNNACLFALYAEVQKTLKAYEDSPSQEKAVEFNAAYSALNGALAVSPKTHSVNQLGKQYEDLLRAHIK